MPLSTASFDGDLVQPELRQQIESAIIGGSPFVTTLTRVPTSRGSVVFPRVLDDSGAAWVNELQSIPLVDFTTDAYTAATSRLSGIILVSREALDDEDFPTDEQVRQQLRAAFSAKLEADFISGAGPAPTPTGVLAVADQVTGPSLAQAAASAKGLIGEEGGNASHIALSPSTIAAEEAREGSDGHPVYPNGLTNVAGLEVVSSVAATQPIVYDRARTYLVERTAFEVTASTDYSPAFEAYAVALRIIGRYSLAVPMVGPAVRKLAITVAP